MLSDGEAWSGEVARAIARARDARCRSSWSAWARLAGDWLARDGQPAAARSRSPHAISRLDRASLQRIAASAGGQYFELDRDADRDIANAIVDAGRRLAPPKSAAPTVIEYYPRLLVAAIVLAGLGMVFVRGRTDLWLQCVSTAVALAVVARVLA